jgi:flagellar motor switch/type III secretory pathway protein FliN
MTTAKIETDGASTTEALAAVADAPVELSVEIARFTLSLGEIATLCTGDVLLTGRPIGEHVTVRAGTRAIATGELVNVDGAIGVRIVALAGT